MIRKLWNAELPFSLAITGIIGMCVIAFLILLIVLENTGPVTLGITP